MGLAASQARLLTITSRLNHVELESQNLSNAKIRLSDSTQKASDEYIKALNKTEYLYNDYDTSGELVSKNLTGAVLTNYGELKNQYGLINSAGQILVSEVDGANYMNSNTLDEFLEKYGVMGELGSGETIQVINPEYKTAMDEYEDLYTKWQTEKPDPANPIYIIPGETTQSDLYDSFLWATSVCYGAVMSYLSTKLGLEGGTITDSNGAPVVKYDNNAIYWYSDDGSGTQIGTEASNPNWRDCYCHVFAHLLQLGSYETSTGEPVTITNGYGSNGHFGHWWGSEANNRGKRAAELAAIISENAENVLYACGDTGKDITTASSETEKLMSDYYFDENGEKQLKTLQQKIVDLDYANAKGLLSDQELYDAIEHFVDHDLKVLNQAPDEFDKDRYLKDLEEWEKLEPQKPDVPMYIDKQTRKITDLDKAQWYINLWHRMNGTSDFKAGFGNSAEYNPEEGWASKSKTEQSWAVLKDGDMNSAEYLKFAIDNGLITLEQVQFVDPSKTEQAVKNIEWTSIIFTNAQDITEQKNQLAITKAETKYQQDLKEIEAKDKQLDIKMKKLDTEHNALQTEYDSIKGVIEKNVERSFKIFS